MVTKFPATEPYNPPSREEALKGIKAAMINAQVLPENDIDIVAKYFLVWNTKGECQAYDTEGMVIEYRVPSLDGRETSTHYMLRILK
ncbi:hypothetical protein [Ewingella americana]|uniref:Uncharacterized protein n=1 Tax=Ewingella americana TaxID=41202 RepID=A0A502GF36_9GAMM|nr:hypothetical protein [Ewingella americana]TPG59900.1 hypothetical protein EAH77_15145 [Ewingella americana]